MQSSGQGPRKSILVIDEDPHIRRLFEIALSEHGFTAHVASARAQALEVCEKYPLRIVLADVDFLGKAGLQLLASMRKMLPDVRICLMTVGLPSYTDDDLNHLGVTLCFSEPISLAQLIAALEQHLQE